MDSALDFKPKVVSEPANFQQYGVQGGFGYQAAQPFQGHGGGFFQPFPQQGPASFGVPQFHPPSYGPVQPMARGRGRPFSRGGRGAFQPQRGAYGVSR